MSCDYSDYFRKSKFMNTRDYVFYRAVELLCNRPAKILEIGTTRSTEPYHHERFSDGWSTMWWCEYARQHGGQVISVDVDNDNIEMAKKITHQYEQIKFLNMDGADVLDHDNNFDLVYLDGSDDPNQMLEQFKLCKRDSVILCDDFQIKGRELKKLDLQRILFTFETSGHQMALFYPECFQTDIIVPEKHLVRQKYQEYYYVNQYQDFEGLLPEHYGWWL